MLVASAAWLAWPPGIPVAGGLPMRELQAKAAKVSRVKSPGATGNLDGERIR